MSGCPPDRGAATSQYRVPCVTPRVKPQECPGPVSSLRAGPIRPWANRFDSWLGSSFHEHHQPSGQRPSDPLDVDRNHTAPSVEPTPTAGE